MTRSRVQLSFIVNDSARKATFKKRKRGLLKKAEELSTLCGVEACAVVCSPYDQEPVVWPDRERAKKVVDDFIDLPEMDRNRKMYDHPSYLYQRILKSSQQLARLQHDNLQKNVALMMYGVVAGEKNLNDLSGVDLNNLLRMIDRNLGDISRRLRMLHADPNAPPEPPAQVPDLPAPPVGGGVGLTGMHMQAVPALWPMEQGIVNPNPLPLQQIMPPQNVRLPLPLPQPPAAAGGVGFELGLSGSAGMHMQGAAPWQMQGRSLGAAPRTYEPGGDSGAAAFGGGPE